MLWLSNWFLYLLTPVSALASLGFVAAVFWNRDGAAKRNFTSKLSAVSAQGKETKSNFPPLRETSLKREPAPSLVEARTRPLKKDLPCMVHEIRNYTSTLRGNTILLRRGMDEALDTEALGRLERAAEKIEHLALEVLSFSSSEAFAQEEVFELDALIENCIRDNFSERQNRIQINGNGLELTVQGDPWKMEQVFLNLIQNAFDAGSDKIDIRLIGNGNRVAVHVEDNGRGCSETDLQKMFTRFFTTRERSGGTGLGLYLVRSIVEDHGGTVRAISKNARGGEATGMIFSLDLPLATIVASKR